MSKRSFFALSSIGLRLVILYITIGIGFVLRILLYSWNRKSKINIGDHLPWMGDFSKHYQLQVLDPSDIPQSILRDPSQPIPTPETLSNVLTFPCIVKPDAGHRSKGLYKIDSYEALAGFLKKTRRRYVIQQFVLGDEYRIRVLPNTKGRSGVTIAGIVRERYEQYEFLDKKKRPVAGSVAILKRVAHQREVVDINTFSPEYTAKIVERSKKLGVNYGRYDCIITEEGEMKFLECNLLYALPIDTYVAGVSRSKFFHEVSTMFYYLSWY